MNAGSGPSPERLRQRAQATSLVRQFFDAQDFVEVTTPTRVAAPGTDVYIEPQPAGDEWLITSPEFHMKRLLAAGMPRIYQFCQCHRREEAGDWHQPEFSMLEWYRANAGFEDVLQDTEQLLQHLASHFCPNGVNTAPLARLLRDAVPARVQLAAPFERLTVREAFRRYAGIHDAAELAAEDELQYFQLLVDQVEPALAAFERPVFLTEYPVSQAALARPCPHDPSVAERFELYLAGVELCNGYGELVDAQLQRQRFEADCRQRAERGLPALPIDEQLLAALPDMPPSGGNALGFERLLALFFGCALTEVIAFAR